MTTPARNAQTAALAEPAPVGADCLSFIEPERKAPEGMGSRVEQFEQIRRDRDREGLSIRGLAVRHGVPKLGSYRAVIDPWLRAPRHPHRPTRPLLKRRLPLPRPKDPRVPARGRLGGSVARWGADV